MDKFIPTKAQLLEIVEHMLVLLEERAQFGLAVGLCGLSFDSIHFTPSNTERRITKGYLFEKYLNRHKPQRMYDFNYWWNRFDPVRRREVLNDVIDQLKQEIADESR